MLMKPGLYANIAAKKARIAAGSGEKMRKPGAKGAPTAKAFRESAKSREDELDDLRFMAGSPDNQWQWPADVLATRGSVQGQTCSTRGLA
jgi:hypothetical protein